MRNMLDDLEGDDDFAAEAADEEEEVDGEKEKNIMKKPASASGVAAMKRPSSASGVALGMFAKKQKVMRKPAAAAAEPQQKQQQPAGIMKKPAAAAAADPQTTIEGDDCDELRDRIKSRKFQLVFASLPAFVQKDFLDAGKDKTGNGRRRQTQIINNTLERENGQLQLADFKGAFFQEMLQRRKTKFLRNTKNGALHIIPMLYIWMHVYIKVQ